MVLSIGTQLGSHEITSLLGKGGMGGLQNPNSMRWMVQTIYKPMHKFIDGRSC